MDFLPHMLNLKIKQSVSHPVLDTNASACKPFGFYCGERISTHIGCGVVIGVNDGKLWFQLDTGGYSCCEKIDTTTAYLRCDFYLKREGIKGTTSGNLWFSSEVFDSKKFEQPFWPKRLLLDFKQLAVDSSLNYYQIHSTTGNVMRSGKQKWSTSDEEVSNLRQKANFIVSARNGVYLVSKPAVQSKWDYMPQVMYNVDDNMHTISLPCNGVTACAINNNQELYYCDKVNFYRFRLDELSVEELFSRKQLKSWVNKSLGKCAGLAASDDGCLYASFINENCIIKIQNSKFVQMYGSFKCAQFVDGPNGVAMFSKPEALVLAENRYLFVQDTTLIRVIDTVTTETSTFVDILYGNGMTKDTQGNVYIVCKDYTIRKLERSWRIEKWLWVAHLKEDPTTCKLASLTRDLIRDITKLLKLPTQ